MSRYLLALLIVTVLPGCKPPEPAVKATPSPAITAIPAPSPTARPPFFSLAAPEPVFRHGETGSWFGDAVEPGAVIRHDGMFHLFFNGFAGWPAPASVGRAVSPDGSEWALPSEEPLLDSSEADFEGFTFFTSSVIRLESGDWAMYLYTLDEGRDGAPGAILVATAPDLDGPWDLQPGYALAPGEAGDWDASRVTQPHVLQVGDEYRMYFAGYENDRLQGVRQIGLAVSVDGLAWEKQPEPVFGPGEELGGWDSYRVFQPRVLQTGDGFLMLYKANVSVGRAEAWGLASSADGVSWERYAGNPVIDENTYGGELRRTGIADLVLYDGDLLLFLEIMEREGGGYHHGNSDYRSNLFLFAHTGQP